MYIYICTESRHRITIYTPCLPVIKQTCPNQNRPYPKRKYIYSFMVHFPVVHIHHIHIDIYIYTYYQRIHHFYHLDLRYHHSNHIKYPPKPAGVAPRFPMACDKTRKEATTIPRVCDLVGKEWLVDLSNLCHLCNGFNVWRIFIHQHGITTESTNPRNPPPDEEQE